MMTRVKPSRGNIVTTIMLIWKYGITRQTLSNTCQINLTDSLPAASKLELDIPQNRI
jgi:hypothetical protein